jgi:hypothetical protein
VLIAAVLRCLGGIRPVRPIADLRLCAACSVAIGGLTWLWVRSKLKWTAVWLPGEIQVKR